MAFYGYHGVDPGPSSSLVSVSSWTSRWPTTCAGPVRPTISRIRSAMPSMYRLTRDIVEGPSCQLLEAVAARIAAAVLSQTPVAGSAGAPPQAGSADQGQYPRRRCRGDHPLAGLGLTRLPAPSCGDVRPALPELFEALLDPRAGGTPAPPPVGTHGSLTLGPARAVNTLRSLVVTAAAAATALRGRQCATSAAAAAAATAPCPSTVSQTRHLPGSTWAVTAATAPASRAVLADCPRCISGAQPAGRPTGLLACAG